MTKLLILHLLAITCLTGCVAAPTLSYKEPLEGPRARVRFATQNMGISVLYSYADNQCQTNEQEMVRLRAGHLFRPEPKRLDMPLWKFHDNGAKEVYVTPGRFVGRFEGGDDPTGVTPYTCIVPFSFDVIAAPDYEVEFAPSIRGCAVLIREIVSDGQGSFERRPTAHLPVSSGDCTSRKIRLR